MACRNFIPSSFTKCVKLCMPQLAVAGRRPNCLRRLAVVVMGPRCGIIRRHVTTNYPLRRTIRIRHSSFSGQRSTARRTVAPAAQPARGAKLIALTFDDGPKPFVLMGTATPKGKSSQSLLGLLDQQGIKATFFVMGWRLSPNADRKCRQDDGGVCRDAAAEEHRRGHEIENHTYGHGEFHQMVKRYGEDWVLNDIDRASKAIQAITGEKPAYLRPPDWSIWPEMQKKIEARGYHVMTKSTAVPPAMRDVDSEDYFCAGANVSKCPKPSDYDYVIQTLQQRERRGISSTSWCSTSCRNQLHCSRGFCRSLRSVVIASCPYGHIWQRLVTDRPQTLCL